MNSQHPKPNRASPLPSSTDTTPLTAGPLPKAALTTAILSALPLLWILLQPSELAWVVSFYTSLPLAAAAFILGLIGIISIRLRRNSLPGLALSTLVLLFWAFCILIIILTVTIA